MQTPAAVTKPKLFSGILWSGHGCQHQGVGGPFSLVAGKPLVRHQMRDVGISTCVLLGLMDLLELGQLPPPRRPRARLPWLGCLPVPQPGPAAAIATAICAASRALFSMSATLVLRLSPPVSASARN